MDKTVQQILREIAQDMEDDATNFDGKPLNGRTVAEYFGHQGAAIGSIGAHHRNADSTTKGGRMKFVVEGRQSATSANRKS